MTTESGAAPIFHIGKYFYVISEKEQKREILSYRITGIYGVPGVYSYEISGCPWGNGQPAPTINIQENDLLQKLDFQIFDNRDGAESYIKNTLTSFEKKALEEKLFQGSVRLFSDKLAELVKDVPIEIATVRIHENINENIKKIKKEYAQYVQE